MTVVESESAVDSRRASWIKTYSAISEGLNIWMRLERSILIRFWHLASGVKKKLMSDLSYPPTHALSKPSISIPEWWKGCCVLGCFFLTYSARGWKYLHTISTELQAGRERVERVRERGSARRRLNVMPTFNVLYMVWDFHCVSLGAAVCFLSIMFTSVSLAPFFISFWSSPLKLFFFFKKNSKNAAFSFPLQEARSAELL